MIIKQAQSAPSRKLYVQSTITHFIGTGTPSEPVNPTRCRQDLPMSPLNEFRGPYKRVSIPTDYPSIESQSISHHG